MSEAKSLDKPMNCVRMTCEVHYLCDAACDNATKITLNYDIWRAYEEPFCVFKSKV